MCGTSAEISVKIRKEVLHQIHAGKTDALENVLHENPNFHWSTIYYDKTGDTILHCAARLGYTHIIEYLLTKFIPKAVDCRNKDDKTALHEAAQFSQYEGCVTLLNYGADVNSIKRADWTPLMLACTKGGTENCLKIVDLLLKNGAIVNYKNKDGWTGVHLISREGDVRILKLLIQYDADIKIKTKNGRTGLHISALHGNKDIVAELIKKGLNPNERDNCGNTSLHEAILGKRLDVCRFLIENGADMKCVNNGDLNLLHLAASEGDVNVIKFVIDLGFDVNEKNRMGWSALHCAARKNRQEAFQFLVQSGADVEIKDAYNRTARDYLSLDLP